MGLDLHRGSIALFPSRGHIVLKASLDMVQLPNLSTNHWERTLGGRRTSQRTCRWPYSTLWHWSCSPAQTHSHGLCLNQALGMALQICWLDFMYPLQTALLQTSPLTAGLVWPWGIISSPALLLLLTYCWAFSSPAAARCSVHLFLDLVPMQGAEAITFRGATTSALTTSLLGGEVFLAQMKKGKGVNASPEQWNEECSLDYLAGS